MILLNILLVPFLVTILLALVIVMGSLGLVSSPHGSSADQSYADEEFYDLYESDVSPDGAEGENTRPLEAEDETSTPHLSKKFPAPSSQLDFEMSSLNIIIM